MNVLFFFVLGLFIGWCLAHLSSLQVKTLSSFLESCFKGLTGLFRKKLK